MFKIRFFLSISAFFWLLKVECSAQWNPNNNLVNVPVTNNCDSTDGNVASVKIDGIFVCPSRQKGVNSQIPDADHFYLVHEYGVLAVHKTSEKLADCWAAHQLHAAPNGPYYVKQWIKHWRIYGRTSPIYGTPEERIANVRRCCACGL